MEYGNRASRKSPVGQPKTAQNGVTANFWPSFTTRPYGKSGENRASYVVKGEKRNSHKLQHGFR
jgi:hypothetical protein